MTATVEGGQLSSISHLLLDTKRARERAATKRKGFGKERAVDHYIPNSFMDSSVSEILLQRKNSTEFYSPVFEAKNIVLCIWRKFKGVSASHCPLYLNAAKIRADIPLQPLVGCLDNSCHFLRKFLLLGLMRAPKFFYKIYFLSILVYGLPWALWGSVVKKKPHKPDTHKIFLPSYPACQSDRRRRYNKMEISILLPHSKQKEIPPLLTSDIPNVPLQMGACFSCLDFLAHCFCWVLAVQEVFECISYVQVV